MTRAFNNVTGGLALALLGAACGGAVNSGVAVGKVGDNVASHTDAAPQGAEVCAVKEAMEANPRGGAEKAAWSEECTKARKRDQLWRRAMIVLAAHGDTLESLAVGEEDNPGHLEGALTSVKGKDWIDVEDEDKPARDAVAQLVDQMSKHNSDTDLEQAVKDAAPHVNKICDGLKRYLEEQATSLGELQKEIEKKRAMPNEKRCGSTNGQTLCVNDTSTDRVIYANAAAQLAVLENTHADARDDVAGFCAAHKKLEDAAKNGSLDDDATYTAVVQAVKSARKGPPPIEASAPAEEKPAGDKAPEPKASGADVKK